MYIKISNKKNKPKKNWEFPSLPFPRTYPYLSKPGPRISFLDFLTLMIESSE
jgi:hypothetical protein